MFIELLLDLALLNISKAFGNKTIDAYSNKDFIKNKQIIIRVYKNNKNKKLVIIL